MVSMHTDAYSMLTLHTSVIVPRPLHAEDDSILCLDMPQYGNPWAEYVKWTAQLSKAVDKQNIIVTLAANLTSDLMFRRYE